MKPLSIDYEYELCELCCKDNNHYRQCYVDELGWINDKEFYVWVPYFWISEFMEEMTEIFGSGLFADGPLKAYVAESGISFDLVSAVGDYVDIESVFPKDKYPH
ncbi:hypothetical protein QE152_g39957 [Popillia japonica]|uniref:Uncharacterized protein n=1 Tax=Popillia japonica TaxID=7064 RepID=A0AAW1HTA4_POPJA